MIVGNPAGCSYIPFQKGVLTTKYQDVKRENVLEIAFGKWVIYFCFLKLSRSLFGISDDGIKFRVFFFI